jgi:hypothetical protein
MRFIGLVVLALATACTGDADGPSGRASGAQTDAAASLCADAARTWGGDVAAAYETTVGAVGAHLTDRHGVDDDTAPPAAGSVRIPAEWSGMHSDDVAAVCYLDGQVPKSPPVGPDGTAQPAFDRRLVVATDGAPSIMVSAGYQSSMPAVPWHEPTSAGAP